MEIRKQRCCMCPAEIESSVICKSPHGYSDKTEKQCTFALTFKDRFGRRYRVAGITGLYEIVCNSRGKTEWNGIPWTHLHHTWDAAQEELNATAIDRGWTPLENVGGTENEMP